jgi:hypothetical protein
MRHWGEAWDEGREQPDAVPSGALGIGGQIWSGVAETKNAANNHSLQLVGQASVRSLFRFIFWAPPQDPSPKS